MINRLTHILNRPLSALGISVGLGLAHLVLQGSLLQIWNLHVSSEQLDQKILSLQKKTQTIDENIKNASDPWYLELKVKERFEMAHEGDLIFVFSDTLNP